MDFHDLAEGTRVAASIDSVESFLQKTHAFHAAEACGFDVQEQRHQLTVHYDGAWHNADEVLVVGNRAILVHVCVLRNGVTSGFFTCLVPQKTMWIGQRVLLLHGEEVYRRFTLAEQLEVAAQLLSTT